MTSRFEPGSEAGVLARKFRQANRGSLAVAVELEARAGRLATVRDDSLLPSPLRGMDYAAKVYGSGQPEPFRGNRLAGLLDLHVERQRLLVEHAPEMVFVVAEVAVRRALQSSGQKEFMLGFLTRHPSKMDFHIIPSDADITPVANYGFAVYSSVAGGEDTVLIEEAAGKESLRMMSSEPYEVGEHKVALRQTINMALPTEQSLELLADMRGR